MKKTNNANKLANEIDKVSKDMEKLRKCFKLNIFEIIALISYVCLLLSLGIFSPLIYVYESKFLGSILLIIIGVGTLILIFGICVIYRKEIKIFIKKQRNHKQKKNVRS